MKYFKKRTLLNGNYYGLGYYGFVRPLSFCRDHNEANRLIWTRLLGLLFVLPLLMTFSLLCHGATTGVWTGLSGAGAGTATIASGTDAEITVTTNNAINANGATFTTTPGATILGTNASYTSTEGNIVGDPALRFEHRWDSVSVNDCDGTSTWTHTFSRPVWDPVLHVDRVGGLSNNLGTANDNSTSSLNTLTTGNSLTLERLSGIGPWFEVSGNTFFRTTNIGPLSIVTQECSANSDSTACGSIRLAGLVSSVTFFIQAHPDLEPASNCTTIGGPFAPFAGDAMELIWEVNQDLSDGPSSYGDPVHGIRNSTASGALYLGSVVPDDEINSQHGIAADGDGVQDDGVGSFPSYTTGSPTYTVPVSLTNTTGASATLCGWIDLNLNNTFDADEQVCNPVASGATSSDLVFDVSAFDLSGSATYYSRFRICSMTSECNDPTTAAADGEVEDYAIPINTLPVTLSHFNSTRSGSRVDVNWGTSSELFNVGFQLWGLDGVDGQWEKLHNWLIRSGSGNAVEPQSYTKRVRIPTSIDQLVSVGISSVDSDGTEHYYGPFELGVSYGELGDLAPIVWDDVRAELDTRMAAQGYTKSGVNGYRKASSTSTLALSGTDNESVIEFRVSTPGVYRITGSELPQEWHSAPKGELAVLDYQGNGVVRHVQAKGQGSGSTRELGAAGSIYFYSEGVNETQRLYSEAKVYRLVLDSARALNAPIQSKQGVTSGFSESYREVSVVEEDESYIFHSAVDDPWLDEVVIGFSDKLRVRRQPVPVEADLLIDDSATLLLGLGRSSALGAIDNDGDGVQDAEHIVTGTVTDADGVKVKLDPVSAVGSGRWDLALPVPAGTLLGDANGIVHSGAFFNAGEGYAFSEVHIDSIGLEYSRPYVSKVGEDHLLFRGPDTGELGYSVTVPDTGWPWVFASDGSNLVRIGLESQRRVTDSAGVKWREVTFSKLLGSDLSPLSIQYWVSGRNGFYGVEDLVAKQIESQASVLAQAQGSDYVMVSHPMFMGPDQAGVDPLSTYAAFKQGQGYTVSIVNYLDIVDSFGGGQVGPWGLTHYLSELKLQSPLLKYVLLVGSSVYDHSDKLGTGALTFIPGHYVPGSHSDYTVSDVPYISNGDGALFAHIGRWPVRELSELQVIVDKSMQWGSTAHHQGEALLIAEHTVLGEEINFAQALDGVAEVLPDTYSQNKVYVDALLAADPDLSLTQALALAKGQIIDALNNAPEVVVYNGHASTGQLSNQNLFKHSDVDEVTTPGAEIWVPLSCYVTYYESTTVNTLAHQLLFTGNAVAITGAMLLSNQAENIQMGQSILDSTFNQGQSIGEAVNQAKTIQNNPNLTHNWATLGDPSSILMTQ